MGSSIQVQVVTLIVLLAFSAVMVAIGIYSSKKTKTLEGFLLGGREIGAWMSAFAYGTSYFSAVIFIGYAGKHGWDIGIASMWIGVGNAVLGCWLAWKVLASRTRAMTHKLSVKTMPEFFEARYGEPRMKTFAALVIFIFLVPYSAAVYKGLGSIFNTIYPTIPVNVCMLIVAVLTAVFLVLGGYVASVITDFVQGLIMIVGVIILVEILLFNPRVDGIFNAYVNLKAISPSLVNPFGGSSFNFLCVNIMLTSFGTWGLPQMIGKFYAVKDDAAIKKATVVSTGFAFIIGVGAYFVGSMGRLILDSPPMLGDKINYDAIVPNILLTALGGSNLFTTFVLAIILVLLLSASMSTLSAVVLTSASAVSVDLLPSIDEKFGDNDLQMYIMRGLCLLFVALSYIFASFQIAIIVSIMSFSWGIVSGSFIGPYIAGLYSKETTKAGAWAGMLGGFLTVMLLTLYTTVTNSFAAASANAPVFGVLAMCVSSGSTPFVSMFTKKLPAELIERAYGDKQQEVQDDLESGN